MKPIFFYNIDVISACNLACPSCPQGNSERLPKGLMAPELLIDILEKATRESRVSGVGLFNWTEPLLHPKIATLVEIVHSFGHLCYLSTNLNYFKTLPDVLKREPHSIRISCSGFTQKTYERTHKGGNIDRVKENMIKLSALRSHKTDVHMLWHSYRDNALEALEMEQFCKMLGFKFIPIDAFYMPLEKVLDVWNKRQPAPPINDLLLTSLDRHKSLCANRVETCRLQTRQMAIDALGNVQLCCSVYDPKKFTLANFLATKLEDIQSLKYGHSQCDSCIKQGGHIYSMGHTHTPPSKLREIALGVAKFLPIKMSVRLKDKLGL